MQLKRLRNQVIVLTGATSGIGLVTAREAARRGARLSLAARSEEALVRLVEELRREGCDAIHTVVDVGVEADVRRLADATVRHFGGFDTWINNAAAAIYGNLEQVPLGDQKRLFDTNFWGMVHGSLIACEHLRERGGKLINVGSVLSERAIPVQGVYSASKAAVMGYTDALRMELEQERAPVSVTLIKPAAIDTPYQDHAANYTYREPRNPPPVYAPETVAMAIFHAVEHQEREIVVGGGGKVVTTLGNAAPRAADKIMGHLMPWLQHGRERLSYTTRGALYEPSHTLEERGGYGMTLEHSLYAIVMRHRAMTTALLLGAGTSFYLLRRAGSMPRLGLPRPPRLSRPRR
jgi:short-subunit dehydrogenase